MEVNDYNKGTYYLKKNQNAPKPSEHPPVKGKKCSLKKKMNASRPSEHPQVREENVKTFRWDHRLQRQEISSWHLNGFPDGSLVGGNPTMNTPRLRRGGGIAPSPFVFYLLYGYSYIIGYFVYDSASEFGAMGSTSFFGFSYPNLLLVFLNLLFLGTCIIFLSQVLGLSLGLFYIIFFVIFLYLILGQLVTTEIRFFALKSKKEKGTG